MKIGLSLGSGAARGLSHIGLLKAFEEEEIVPYAISGSSMGALIGGAYAAGYDMATLDKKIRNLDWKIFTEFFDIKISRNGIVDGKKIEKFIYEFTGDIDISMLEVKFSCVATDVLTGREVVFNSGSLIKAIRASISFPGIFVPQYYEDHFLIDGGIRNPVPVDLLPGECDIKFAVDVGPFVEKEKFVTKIKNGTKKRDEKKKEKFSFSLNNIIKDILSRNGDDEEVVYPNIFETLIQTVAIMQNSVFESKLKANSDCQIIRPQLNKFKLTDFTSAAEIIDIGYEEGKRMIKEYIYEN
ncbi:patatin-like phospholipase family protein [Flexistipes sp.]|uniref:patatin-like phospholipase family protein n=1 Tax=Flexistipes sp. TaxID=3088135 RepID=UPI002E2408A3|nr:patatin-like phospholipase family protein [Flexistipes sp.]